MLRHGIGGTEALILLLIPLLVFGSKRLPDTARSVGRSLRILKSETQGLREDGGHDASKEPHAVPPSFDDTTGEPLQRYDPYTGEPLKRSVPMAKATDAT